MLFQIFISRMIESRGAAAVCTDEKCSITQRTQESMRINECWAGWGKCFHYLLLHHLPEIIKDDLSNKVS